jgi:hypothetical protein
VKTNAGGKKENLFGKVFDKRRKNVFSQSVLTEKSEIREFSALFAWLISHQL